MYLIKLVGSYFLNIIHILLPTKIATALAIKTGTTICPISKSITNLLLDLISLDIFLRLSNQSAKKNFLGS